MNPDQQQPLGRSRGRGGRSLYAHPQQSEANEPPPPQRGPGWSLTHGGPRPPFPPPSGQYAISQKPQTGSSSEETSGAIGRGDRGAKTHGDIKQIGRGVISKTGSGSGSDRKAIVYPEPRPDPKEEERKKREAELALYRTRPKDIKTKVGESGQKITCEANFFRIKKAPTWKIHQYHVTFETEILLEKTRRQLIFQIREMFGGGYLFDGTQLFLTIKLVDDPLERTIKGEDGTVVKMVIKFTGIVTMLESRATQIQNLILRRAMDGLKLQTIGRNKFDAAARERVPNLRLEVWPGYITSIRQHESDMMLCVEISHKIMRAETIYDIMNRTRTEERNFKEAIEKSLLGTTVLTDYNNKTYRIDDIKFDMCPLDTFPTKDGDISFVEYYKKKYNKIIRDEKQPLLLSNPKARDIRAGQTGPVILIPELCRATGITDEMRSNFRTMKELAKFTKLGPIQRIDRLKDFNRRLANCPESRDVLKNWNLELDPELIKIPGRILPFPKLEFDRVIEIGTRTDWTAEFRNRKMFRSTDLKRWYLVVPKRCAAEAEVFLKALKQAASGMHFILSNPRIMEMEDDRQLTISNALQECGNQNPQMIMCVVSNNQADRYATIKKRCYIDFGIPSQVIVHKTITPKDKSRGASGLLSVATKVAIQMNCKLGGMPWTFEMPVGKMMTMGFDVCHDPKDKNASWGALVATMDLKAKNTEFFSAVSRHTKNEEISNFLSQNIAKALQQFYEINESLPEKILFFRDGVGDGQIQYVVENEIEAIRKKLKEFYYRQGIPDEVKFTYMIVTKRVNTRIFFDRKNPEPGTCIDDVITLPERYDFYLVPQSVREGTVTPTGFNIVHDTSGIPPDRLQQLAFRFTFFYFNWSGTVRVPAPCQYAHKLAFLASQSMQGTPHAKLERTLYYL